MTVRSAVRRACLAALAAPLLVALSACGASDSVPAGEPWPLTLDDPAVLGYASLQPQGDALAQFMQQTVGWTPAGLADALPVVLVHFDARTYGGALGVVFPVRDEQAFRASLRATPSLEALGPDHYRLTIPTDTELGQLLAMASHMQAPSPLAALASLAQAGSAGIPLHLDLRDGHASMAPSLEALGVCRRLVEATRGFEQAPSRPFVVSLDLQRLRIAHAEQIRAWDQQLRNLISGARAGGSLMGLMQMAASSHENRAPPRVNWEMLWALKEMLAFDQMDAAQLGLDIWTARDADESKQDAPDASRRVPDEEDDVLDNVPDDEWDGPLGVLPGLPFAASLRLSFSDDSHLADVLDTLAPGPEVEGAAFTLRADPQRFPRAFAEWCRPLAEVVKGEGPPCERYLDELVRLLSGWGGLLAVRAGDDGPPMILADMGSGQDGDAEALAAWLAPLLSTARIEGWGEGVRSEPLPDGRRVFMDAQGEPTLTVGRAGRVLWVASGAAEPPPASVLATIEDARERAPGDGVPGFRFRLGGSQWTLRTSGRQLSLGLLVTSRTTDR